MAHENLLPALERCSLLVSRLRGLSRYQDSNATLGLSTQALNDVLDVISCLSLLAHSILKYAGTELRQFSSFSTWLRHEIDVQAADPMSAEDPAEKDQTIEHANVLEYIQGPMRRSKLARIFLPSVAGDQFPVIGSSPKTQAFYDGFRMDMASYDNDIGAQVDIPSLCNLTELLERQCGVVFAQIAEAQKRNVLFGSPIKLGPYIGGKPVDMRMLYEVRLY